LSAASSLACSLNGRCGWGLRIEDGVLDNTKAKGLYTSFLKGMLKALGRAILVEGESP
jgi:hypothetical protein